MKGQKDWFGCPDVETGANDVVIEDTSFDFLEDIVFEPSNRDRGRRRHGSCNRNSNCGDRYRGRDKSRISLHLHYESGKLHGLAISMIVSFDDGLLAVLLSNNELFELNSRNETIGFIDGFIEFSFLDFKKS